MTRPMVTVGASFLAAVFLLSLIPLGPPALWLVPVLLGALGVAFALSKKPRRVFLSAVFFSALAGSLCWIFFLLGESFDYQSLSGRTVRLQGTVTDIRATSGTRLALHLRLPREEGLSLLREGEEHPGETLPGGINAILYVPGETEAEIGDLLSLRAKCLSLPASPGFDLADYYRSEGIRLTLSTYEPPMIIRPSSAPLWSLPRRLNQSLCETVDRLYAAPYSGLVRAMLLGDRSQLDGLLYSRFSRVGITHIFVVSGLHVSLMAGLCYLVLKRLRLSPRIRGILCLAVSWGFVALTGFGLPAVRAGIMTTLLLLGGFCRRPADSLNSLWMAGMLIVLLSPEAILSGGFLLSVTATLGVLLLSRPISEGIVKGLGLSFKPLRAGAGLVGCSLGANLTMLPVSFRLFRGISLVFPLSNLLSLPLVPMILALSALSLLLSPVPAAARAVARLVEGLLFLLIKCAELLSSLPYCYLGLDSPVAALCLFFGLALVLFMLLWRPRLVGQAIACVLCLLIGGLLLERLAEQNTVEITPVCSFNGVSVVIRQGDKASVVALEDDGQVEETVEEFLRGKNVSRVEDLILTYKAPATLSDTVFLAKSLEVDRFFAGEELEVLPYVGELFSPLQGGYALKDGSGYRLSSLPGDGQLEVFRQEGETIALATVGGVRVGITGSAAMAAQSECEILFYSGENPENLKQIPLKYVILLKKPGLESLPDGVWPAYERQGSLLLDQKGRFRMG